MAITLGVLRDRRSSLLFYPPLIHTNCHMIVRVPGHLMLLRSTCHNLGFTLIGLSDICMYLYPRYLLENALSSLNCNALDVAGGQQLSPELNVCFKVILTSSTSIIKENFGTVIRMTQPPGDLSILHLLRAVMVQ